MKSQLRFLIVGDEEQQLARLNRLITDAMPELSAALDTAATFAEGLQATDERDYDLILAELKLYDESGIDFLHKLRGRNVRTPLIFLSCSEDDETAASVMIAGAVDCLPAQLSSTRLARSVRSALRPDVQAQTRSSLRLCEASLLALVEKNADGMVIVDERGDFRFVNPAAETFFERSEEELVAAPFGSPLVGGETTQIDVRQKGGAMVTAEMRVVEIVWEGERAFLLSLRDVTNRKQAEDETQRLNVELERRVAERTAQLEAASRAKDEFLATLSHELRTPLNAILGWSQLLTQGHPSPEDISQGMETIARNALAQGQLIEDLLDMSRIISGKLRLDFAPVNLSVIVEAAVESAQPAAEAKGIRLQSKLDPAVGPVAGDAGRLQQAVWNLLTNAIKFTPRDGIVEVTLGPVHSHLEIVVNDNGRGIEPGFLPYVFDRFRQADSSSTRGEGGLGIGLSLVKQLVELHGGSVRARSEGKGKGSTFAITLPLVAFGTEDDGQPTQPTTTQGEQALDNASILNGVTIIAVDDEPDARELVRRLLQKYGATVFTAASADEGLEAVKRHKPDVIVSDIGMPDKDGYEFLRTVRALSGRCGTTPAIALTAFAHSEDRRRAMTAGFQVHLDKPVEATELVAAIARLAGRAGV
ncbi:MAG: hybrid sensor histidine kinase/response regulator [Phycisphaerales bacterium]|nr:hybrid sensor histidine kinase/response regulator [Phycisphaerales bacterium]